MALYITKWYFIKYLCHKIGQKKYNLVVENVCLSLITVIPNVNIFFFFRKKKVYLLTSRRIVPPHPMCRYTEVKEKDKSLFWKHDFKSYPISCMKKNWSSMTMQGCIHQEEHKKKVGLLVLLPLTIFHWPCTNLFLIASKCFDGEKNFTNHRWPFHIKTCRTLLKRCWKDAW